MRTLLALFILTSTAYAAPRVIYGDDNRIDVEHIINPQIKLLSNSIAGRVSNANILIHGDTFNYGHTPKLSDPWTENVCSDEKFANQKSLPDCTGFLVGPDLLATAAHCVMNTDEIIKNEETRLCTKYVWVFDYKTKGGKVKTRGLSVNKIYKCKEVIVADYRGMNDYALVRLDREVEGRLPLKIRRVGQVKKNMRLFTVGHPSGLPLKYTDKGSVVSNDEKEFFTVSLDTFHGNSGSPVFNSETLEVEGILVRGRTDYVDGEFEGKYCQRVNRCEQDGKNCEIDDPEFEGQGEHATRITRLLKYLP